MTIWQASFCFVGYNNFGKHLHLNKSTAIYFRTINTIVHVGSCDTSLPTIIYGSVVLFVVPKIRETRLILHIFRITPIYNLFTVKTPRKENALISGYWIKLEGLWTLCICLEQP